MVTGTSGNPDFSHTATSDGAGLLESDDTVLLPLGGTEQMGGYLVGDGGALSEEHTHTFTAPVGSVQVRHRRLNTVETLVFTLDGQALNLNEAIGLGWCRSIRAARPISSMPAATLHRPPIPPGPLSRQR